MFKSFFAKTTIKKNLHFIVNPDIGFETLKALSSQKYLSKGFSMSCLNAAIETENLYL